MLRCLKLNGRFLRTEIEGGRCSTEGCFRVPPSEYSVSSHLANEYTNVAPRKTSVFRVDNISDITLLGMEIAILGCGSLEHGSGGQRHKSTCTDMVPWIEI